MINEAHHATRCADTIRNYWLARGYAGIRVWVEAQGRPGRSELLHIIKSNIGLQGFPPKVAGEAEPSPLVVRTAQDSGG